MNSFASKPLSVSEFQRKVKAAGKEHHRDFPWRYIDDPYAVLVSEVMLQQTQVKRVLDYWPRFMRTFPSIDALAAADTPLVLEMWQGLGYNRRALALKKCAETCSRDYQGCLPNTREELLALPGIGPATAGGVLAFAYQKPTLYLETNVRTVFLHELFPDECDVPDKLIEPLVLESCPSDDPRGWYYALLDYGAYLKATEPNPSRRSKHYSKQSKFEGSRRQKRAEILRTLLASEGLTKSQISVELAQFERAHKRNAPDEALVEGILADLVSEGFLRLENGLYSVG
ncbi:MAG: adenine glycosylase [Coriobacteriia bacterium]|nr:adenine glycosylase [Coriobacteriia bacterium]